MYRFLKLLASNMSGPLKVVNLKCASCGGALEIHPDMDQFACGYCGSEQLVERRGGTISLKRVIDAVTRVQTGTDKTAAELALVRLERELGTARQRWNESDAVFRRNHRSSSTLGTFLMVLSPIGGLTLVGATGEAESFPEAVLLSVLAASSVPVFIWGYKLHQKARKGYNELRSSMWKTHSERIHRLEERIEHNRKFVE